MSDAVGPFGTLSSTRLRVLTWNLWWRFGPWEARLPAIAATLARIDADVIALQEVWQEGERNQAAELAAGLGFHHAYATRFEHDDLKFGNAVLSRWPIASQAVLELPAPPDKEEMRTCLRADVDGPRGPIQLFSTHLNWRFDHSAERQEQVRAIAAFVCDAPERSYPPVLCGDFNASPDSDEIRMLTGKAAVPAPPLVFHDAWEYAASTGATVGDGTTWSNHNPYAALDLEPDRRIDYVFAGWPKRGGAGQVLHAAVEGTEAVEGVHPSDHLAVLAELRY